MKMLPIGTGNRLLALDVENSTPFDMQQQTQEWKNLSKVIKIT